MLHHSLSRQFRMNDPNNHYHQLEHLYFQIQCLPLQCPEGALDVCKCMPQTLVGLGPSMASRSEAHETFLLLFLRDGVPPPHFCDNAMEMIQGKFNKKLNEAAPHLKQLEMLQKERRKSLRKGLVIKC